MLGGLERVCGMSLSNAIALCAWRSGPCMPWQWLRRPLPNTRPNQTVTQKGYYCSATEQCLLFAALEGKGRSGDAMSSLSAPPGADLTGALVRKFGNLGEEELQAFLALIKVKGRVSRGEDIVGFVST